MILNVSNRIPCKHGVTAGIKQDWIIKVVAIWRSVLKSVSLYVPKQNELMLS
jgi:hypothetical protein